MNDDRVRIYDLSKELKLNNKDLLAICQHLNIAVKSHSNTISESEAERIRTLAKKQASLLTSPQKETTTKPILEIRAPKTPEPSQVTAQATDSVSSSKTMSSDVDRTSSSQSKPAKPGQQRPHLTKPPARPTPPVAPTQEKKEFQQPRKDRTQKPRHQGKPADSQEQPSTETPRPKVARPSQPKPSATPHPKQPVKTAEAGSAENVPKVAKQTTGQPSQTPHPIKREQPKQVKRRPSERPGGAEAGPTKAPERPASPSIPQLHRPKVSRSTESELSAAEARAQTTSEKEDSSDTFVERDELLKRPQLNRPSKVNKKSRKEEEVDEALEVKSKVGPKSKRLKPIIDDEDFDWDETDLEGTSIVISPAVARPPKQSKPPVKTSGAVATVGAVKQRSVNSRAQERHQQEEQKRERPEKVLVTGPMTVLELADALAIADTEIVKILFFKGMAVTITQSLDIPTITLIGEELGVQVETSEKEAEARKLTEMLDIEDLENLQRRPPVVTIMGHVDHGKTTLLDSIRHTRVAQGEAGGITQHVGAYHVDVEHDGKMQQVVFLDTPGHEAFTAMRARGARVTDIAILVVAADDGVRPQTVEAISHARAAEVPIIVAINKIDKPEAQPDRVRQELTEYGLLAEEWGGDTIMVPVSAIKGENLETLLEMILLVAEVEELSANPNRPARGTVIEAHLDKAKGPVATLLIQNGTLRVGDLLVAGSAFGKVRAMVGDTGSRVEAATPSFAVEVLGLNDVPAAGDEFEVFQNEKQARAIADKRSEKQRQSRLMQGRVTLATLSAQAQEGKLKELNLIIKADVQGSLEAIIGALRQIPQQEVQIRLLLAAPGEITETDIDLAAASNAVLVGFNTTYASGARQAADEAGVDVREYNIIYKLLEDIQGALEGLLEPELVEEPLGQAEVRAVFPVSRGKVAGCYILSGKVYRNSKLRVRRGGQVIYDGALDSLKRMKEDVREVNSGYECGIGVDKFNDWQEGDIIEAYHMVTKRRTLSAPMAATR